MPMAQDSPQPTLHWLTAAVVNTGLVSNLAPKDILAAIPAGTDTTEAWTLASDGFGLNQEQIAQIVAAAYGLQAANTRFLQPEASTFIPEDVARTLGIVPVRHTDATIVVATANPLDQGIEGAVNKLSGRRAVLAVAGPTAIRAAQHRVYNATEPAAFVLSNLHLKTAMQRVELPAKAQTLPSRASAVERLIRLIFFEAVKGQATEIRLEPKDRGGKIAFRVAGESRTFVYLPVAVILRIMARIRHWARSGLLDQEGRMLIRIDGQRVDLTLKLDGTEALDPICIAVKAPASAATIPLAPSRAADAEEPATPNWSNTPTALVVDDEAGDRLLLRTMLKRSGFDIVEAVDGVEALTKLQGERDFDVVLLDLMMPRMSGLDVLTRLRRTVRTAGMPVIVVTASEDPEDRRRLLEAGADDYLQKPIDPPKVVHRVKSLLRRSLPVA